MKFLTNSTYSIILSVFVSLVFFLPLDLLGVTLDEQSSSNPQNAYFNKLDAINTSLDLLEQRLQLYGKKAPHKEALLEKQEPKIKDPIKVDISPDQPDEKPPQLSSSSPAIENGDPQINSNHKNKDDYYLSLITNLNFPSDTKMKTLSGIGKLDHEVGFGLEAEFGRSFDYVDLGFAFAYDRHNLEDLIIGSVPLGGDGRNTAYRFLFKPALKFKINDIVGFKSGLDLGLISRHSSFSIPSIDFTESGDSISFVWGLRLSLFAQLNENHALFAGYAFSDYPKVDNFNDITVSTLEAGYIGRF